MQNKTVYITTEIDFIAFSRTISLYLNVHACSVQNNVLYSFIQTTNTGYCH